jgi:hypothetical protein
MEDERTFNPVGSDNGVGAWYVAADSLFPWACRLVYAISKNGLVRRSLCNLCYLALVRLAGARERRETVKRKPDWAAKAALRYYGIWDNETKALAKLLRRAEKRGRASGFNEGAEWMKQKISGARP